MRLLNGLGAKGIVAKPLDCGTLSLVGNAHAGDGYRGGTGPSSSVRHAQQQLL
jgi:hypothetical protein